MAEWIIWHSLIVLLIISISFYCGYIIGKLEVKSDFIKSIFIRLNPKR